MCPLLRQVLVTVYDVNDYQPRFTESVFNTSVFENEPTGTSVITVRAIDLDEGDNAVIIYTMMTQDLGKSPVSRLLFLRL